MTYTIKPKINISIVANELLCKKLFSDIHSELVSALTASLKTASNEDIIIDLDFTCVTDIDKLNHSSKSVSFRQAHQLAAAHQYLDEGLRALLQKLDDGFGSSVILKLNLSDFNCSEATEQAIIKLLSNGPNQLHLILHNTKENPFEYEMTPRSVKIDGYSEHRDKYSNWPRYEKFLELIIERLLELKAGQVKGQVNLTFDAVEYDTERAYARKLIAVCQHIHSIEADIKLDIRYGFALTDYSYLSNGSLYDPTLIKLLNLRSTHSKIIHIELKYQYSTPLQLLNHNDYVWGPSEHLPINEAASLKTANIQQSLILLIGSPTHSYSGHEDWSLDKLSNVFNEVTFTYPITLVFDANTTADCFDTTIFEEQLCYLAQMSASDSNVSIQYDRTAHDKDRLSKIDEVISYDNHELTRYAARYPTNFINMRLFLKAIYKHSQDQFKLLVEVENDLLDSICDLTITTDTDLVAIDNFLVVMADLLSTLDVKTNELDLLIKLIKDDYTRRKEFPLFGRDDLPTVEVIAGFNQLADFETQLVAEHGPLDVLQSCLKSYLNPLGDVRSLQIDLQFILYIINYSLDDDKLDKCKKFIVNWDVRYAISRSSIFDSRHEAHTIAKILIYAACFKIGLYRLFEFLDGLKFEEQLMLIEKIEPLLQINMPANNALDLLRMIHYDCRDTESGEVLGTPMTSDEAWSLKFISQVFAIISFGSHICFKLTAAYFSLYSFDNDLLDFATIVTSDTPLEIKLDIEKLGEEQKSRIRDVHTIAKSTSSVRTILCKLIQDDNKRREEVAADKDPPFMNHDLLSDFTRLTQLEDKLLELNLSELVDDWLKQYSESLISLESLHVRIHCVFIMIDMGMMPETVNQIKTFLTKYNSAIDTSHIYQLQHGPALIANLLCFAAYLSHSLDITLQRYNECEQNNQLEFLKGCGIRLKQLTAQRSCEKPKQAPYAKDRLFAGVHSETVDPALTTNTGTHTSAAQCN